MTGEVKVFFGVLSVEELDGGRVFDLEKSACSVCRFEKSLGVRYVFDTLFCVGNLFGGSCSSEGAVV